jgi:putative MATE family efflux protein
MNTNALLTAPIGSTIARMAAPSTLAMFMALATSSMEAWYAGQIGVQALAGLALAFPMFMLITMVSAGAVGGAIAGAIAQALGAGAHQRAESIALHAVLIAVVLGLLAGLVFLAFGHGIFSLLGGKGAVLDQALAYSNVFFAGGVLIWLANISSSIVRACGHMRFAAFALIAGSLVQIAVGAILVLGLGPFPELGVAGVAWAVLAGAVIANILLFTYLFSGRAGIYLRLSGVPLSLPRFMDLLKPGVIASLSPLSSIATVSVLTALVARQGEAVLAGFGIGTRIEFLLIPLVFGIGAALITLVGVHFGAGEIERGHRVAWIGAAAAAVITGAIGFVLALFPGLWANAFTDVAAVRDACSAYLRIVGPFYGFFGLGLALFFASQGARKLAWPVAAGLFRLLLVAGFGTVMLTLPDVSAEHIFALAGLGLASYGLLMAAIVKLGAWRNAAPLSVA